MNIHSGWIRNYLRILSFSSIAACGSSIGMAAPITFFDDFNRADGAVGNGWLSTSGNIGGELSLLGGALTTPSTSGAAGIYRPVDFSAPVTMSATLTESNGFGGVPNRYESGFLFGGNGSRTSGYEVLFAHSDLNFANSSVRLLYNGAQVASVASPFQFGTSITPTVTYNPDGSFTGVVREGASTFNFNFAAASRALAGNNIGIDLEFPDARLGPIIRPTLDDVTIGYGVAISPKPASFGPVEVPFANFPIPQGAPGYSLTFQDSKFIVDFPIFLESDVSGPGPDALLDSWMNAIDNSWSRFDVLDQNNSRYSFDFNAHIVQDSSLSLATLNLRGLIGSPNPPCRFNGKINSPDCLVPRVNSLNGKMEMYTGLQAFCYVDSTNNTVLKSCEIRAGLERMICRNPDGSTLLLDGQSFLCYDIGSNQTFVSAHEFGHLLGLPDEYDSVNSAQSLKDLLCVKYNLPGEECTDSGIMEFVGSPTQKRYYDVLFSNLSSLTPGFQWTFGLSPDWINENPINPALEDIFTNFEIPVQPRNVPEPTILMLLSCGFMFFLVFRRRLTNKKLFTTSSD
jgi:hypothetical protein